MTQEPAWLTEDANFRVRELWARGDTTAAIGQRFGVTKNAVVGRVHRLGLSRPSPIKPANGKPQSPGGRPMGRPPVSTPDQRQRVIALAAAGRKVIDISRTMGFSRDTIDRILAPKIVRPVVIAAPPAPKLMLPPPAPPIIVALPPSPPEPLPPEPLPPPVIATPVPRPPPVARVHRGECCWLSGERPYQQCDQPRIGKHPYCLAHSKRAYLSTARQQHAADSQAHLGDD
jgi:GcrA cell cycle regulator